MNIYPAPPPPAARSASGLLAGLAPDLRRDPREALRDMSLRGEAFFIVRARLDGATLEEQVISDPYEDRPGAPGWRFSILRRPEGEIVVLQIPEWIANLGTFVGALDEMRYAFRGKVVRVISEGVDVPSLGLGRLLRNWSQEQIDGAFVEWRYLAELHEGQHQLATVLRFPPPVPAPTAKRAAGSDEVLPVVFVSYAHEDAAWYRRLLQMFGPLKHRYPGAIWHDGLIQPGANWFARISASLASAQIVVLMVTPAFLDSPFIHAHELQPLLRAVEAGEKLLLWVYVSTCAYDDAGIGKYQAAHDITEPIDALSPADQNKQLKKVYDSVSAALAPLVTV